MNISVVIPAFNEEAYLSSCLASLEAQIKPPYEIIVVDNNSTDKTQEIAKKYGAKVVLEPTQSTISSRNCGFNLASGDIIARLDADSIALSDWIQRINDNFESKEIVALSGTAEFNELGVFGKTSLYVNIFAKTLAGILKHNILIGPNMAITKDVWNKVKDQICMDALEVHEDIDLSIHIAKYGKIAFDPELRVQMSARRIRKNPFSFFVEYPIRLFRTIQKHKK